MTTDDLCRIVPGSAREKAMKSIVGHGGCITGLAGSSAALMLAALKTEKGIVLVVGKDRDDAGYLYYDLCRLCGEERVAFLPSGFKRDIKYGQADAPAQILRNDVLARCVAGTVSFVVSYPEALAESVATSENLAENTLSLKVNESADMLEVEKWLRDRGFKSVDYVYEPGQYARRGSLLDVFSYASELPVRIDFFGDEIDSIREFDVQTQLSERRMDVVALSSNAGTGGDLQSLPEFLPDNTVVALRNEAYTVERVRAISGEGISSLALLAQEGDADAVDTVVDADAFAARLQQLKRFEFSSSLGETRGEDTEQQPKRRRAHELDFECSPQGIFHKNFDLIGESFRKFQNEGYTIYILSDNEKQFDRLREIFRDRGDDIDFTAVSGTLHEGFVDHLSKVCVFTDHQIFDRFHKYTLKSDRARSGKLALSLKELSQIEPGDYIVHSDHGVGRFAGLLRTNINGKMQEVIKLVYQNDDILFVSIHSLHKLAKYRGKEGVAPKVSRMGSGQWQKMKERTKEKLKDIARDLIMLYSKRREEKGFAFSPDTYMQHELEASFIYEDTPDQLTATQAVKADMESERPMDRLICGDVGFGKTEVAIRAAFKAATDGKQVAVLVPTTVLAYQHYHTFKDRLKDFPVRVDYLSRARSAKETKQVLADLEAGKVDIIIGTHKLIGKNVKFKDLGLLVVDEEQKFGVAVKEKLRTLKVNIDTLTMSATPIPRTLQFSLMGARDLSSITTPPPNRYPIITSLDVLSDELVKEAVNFELARGGQVFFVNNRIEQLYDLEAMLRRVVPDARTVVAHGQMPPEKLEKTINDFAAHDYDILLATSIIESGVDMPNVNTIIINNAQGFGLSALHQLRGRVGRSSRKAFCYLTVPAGKPLTDEARRRLQAIESFSDLGSGIHIAMQDLDIRGAGNLLGAEQSGFIADLGYETYQKVLREAVVELRTEEFPELAAADEKGDEFVADCTFESDLELLLPPDYVPQAGERIALYQELDGIDREDALKAFEERLEDRFGRIPDVARELLKVPRLRRLARKLGLEKVVIKQNSMFTYFVDESNKAYYNSPMFGRMLNYLQQNAGKVEIRQRNNRRSFAFTGVRTVAEAVDILQYIMTMDSL
ncbi:MAG: transcription-repair coupling factor [Muribaculaceae bacterium]|nr:transcription-repair coupling factor [Muribaculaceae bacterium]